MNRITLEEIQTLIAESAEESWDLEFKKPTSNIKEVIEKPVCAFANANGGRIIIGIDEIDNGKPTRNLVGTPFKKSDFAKQNAHSISQFLESRIVPKIQTIDAYEVVEANGDYYLVFDIGRSPDAPHQHSDCKYYTRRQYQNLAMRDFEISDIIAGRNLAKSDVLFTLDLLNNHYTADLIVENFSNTSFYDVSILFDPVFINIARSIMKRLPIGNELADDGKIAFQYLMPRENRKYRIFALNDFGEIIKLANGQQFDFTLTFKDYKDIVHRKKITFDPASFDMLSRANIDPSVKALEEISASLKKIEKKLK